MAIPGLLRLRLAMTRSGAATPTKNQAPQSGGFFKIQIKKLNYLYVLFIIMLAEYSENVF
jgi:hypothetical protein